MMDYSCPECRSGLRIHDIGCEFGDVDMSNIEKAHVDILSIMTRAPQTRYDLVKNIHGEWSDVHSEIFDRFNRENRIESIGELEQEGSQETVWRLLTADEYHEQSKQPQHADLKAIYEQGPVDGCKDDAVVAMIAYWEMVGLSWDETRESAIEWLTETGAWNRGSWGESSPEELVDSKRHVYESGYGWKNAASQAASVIRSTGAP